MKAEPSSIRGGGGNRTRSFFDWRAYAERILSRQRTPASIVVGKLIGEYFSDVTIQRFNESRRPEVAA
jgi:hypothetical protein